MQKQFSMELNSEQRMWLMAVHLSVFAAYIVPILGIVAPIVIWQLKKDEIPTMDDHGKVVANFIISSFLYLLIIIALCFVLIGVPLLFVWGIAAIVLPVIGGIKANNGELWPYPLIISFLK